MAAFLAIGAFVGIILGLRFSVFILVPAILFAIAVITPIDVAARQSAGIIFVTVFATAALVEIGYVAGRVFESVAETRAPAWLMRSRLFKSELTNQNSERHNDRLVDDVASQSDVLERGDVPANYLDATSEIVLTEGEAPPIFGAKEKITDFDIVPSAERRLRK